PDDVPRHLIPRGDPRLELRVHRPVGARERAVELEPVAFGVHRDALLVVAGVGAHVDAIRRVGLRGLGERPADARVRTCASSVSSRVIAVLGADEDTVLLVDTQRLEVARELRAGWRRRLVTVPRATSGTAVLAAGCIARRARA